MGENLSLQTLCSRLSYGYRYEKNLQGDIVAIYNASGTKLVSYVYDAWGNVTRTYHNGGSSTGAAKNPFTYRGYYYDWDTGFYYLQSRYYDPAVGRFINADGYVSTGQGLIGNNMFAYCNNNPVMYVDRNGESGLLFILLLGAVALGLTSSTSTPKKDTEISKDDIHLYDSKTGTPQEGKINVAFSPNGPNPSFQIKDSYKIKKEKDQRTILKYIMESEYYDQKIYQRTMDSMIIEWKAHNDLYRLWKHKRLADVDFDKKSEGMWYIEFYFLAIKEATK